MTESLSRPVGFRTIPRVLMLVLAVVIGIGVSVPLHARGDEVDIDSPPLHEYLIDHLEGFHREGDEYIEPALAAVEPQGPAGRAMRDFRFGEGLRRGFLSFDRSRMVIVAVQDFRAASDSFLYRGVDWGPDDVTHNDDRGTVIHYESPLPEYVGRGERKMVSRFLVEVGVLVRSDAFGSKEDAEKELDFLADQVANEQFALVPELPDLPIPLNDPGLRTLFRAASALLLPVVYLAMWLFNSARGLASRLRVSSRRLPINGHLEGVVYVDVSRFSRSQRLAARLVATAAAVAYVIGVALTWKMGTGSDLVLVGMWLAAILLARRFLFPRDKSRGNYRAGLMAIGWVRGPISFGALICLALAGLYAIRMGLYGYLFGLPAGEHASWDPSGAMQLRFSQTVIGLGVLAFGLVPLVYRWLQAAARRRMRSVVAIDDRPPVLYLRSFRDDKRKVRAKRVDRHSLFEYLVPGGSDRFDEIVAWALWRKGPVVAIGEPWRPVAAIGAAREYYDTDVDWQSAVARHSSAAPAIAVTVGLSQGVVWELEHLREKGHLDRTIFVFPPTGIRDVRERLKVLRKLLLPSLDDDVVDQLARLPILVLRIGELGEPIAYVGRRMDGPDYVAALERAADDITAAPPTEPDDAAEDTTMAPPPPHPFWLVIWAARLPVAAVMILFPFWFQMAVPDPDEDRIPENPLIERGNLPTCSNPQNIEVMEQPFVAFATCPSTGMVTRTDAQGAMQSVDLGPYHHSVVLLDNDRAVVGDRREPVLYELSVDPFELVGTHEILESPSSSLTVVDGRLYITHPDTEEVTVLSTDLEVERVFNLDAVPRSVMDAGLGEPVLIMSHPPAVSAIRKEDGAQEVLVNSVAAPNAAVAIGDAIFVADAGARRVLRVGESGTPEEVATVEVTDLMVFNGNLVVVTYDAFYVYTPEGEALWEQRAENPRLALYGDGIVFTDYFSGEEQPSRLRIYQPR